METSCVRKRISTRTNSDVDKDTQKENEAHAKDEMPKTKSWLGLDPLSLALLITGFVVDGACLTSVIVLVVLGTHHDDGHSLYSPSGDHYVIVSSMDNATGNSPSAGFPIDNRTHPVAWVLNDMAEDAEASLAVVVNVLRQAGYRIETRPNYEGDFNLLYTHQNIFHRTGHVRDQIAEDHVVNHFPGIGLLAINITFLSNCQKFDFIPRTFPLPPDKDKFLAYAERHPNKRWVQTSHNQRHVQPKALNDIDLEDESTFIQEFLEDLLLVDGRRFDIGVFTMITSISPLRVYIFDDWDVRYCVDELDAKNTTNPKSYVTTMEHNQMPSFSSTLGYRSRRQAILHNLHSRGFDVELLVDKLAAAIHQVIRHSSGYIQRQTLEVNVSGQNLYELMRFDFMVGENVDVYLLEATTSPSLDLPLDTTQKLVHDMFSLVGVVNSWGGPVTQWPEEMRRLLVTDIDLQVDIERCALTCQGDNCTEERCRWCVDCISPEDVAMLKRTYVEHTKRGRWRRIVPAPFKSQASALTWNPDDDDTFANMDSGDRLLTTWFRGKCLLDQSWCT